MAAPQWFGLFIMLGGAICALGGVESVFRRRTMLRRAVRVAAAVTRLRRDWDSDSEATYEIPVVRYQTPEGKAMECPLGVSFGVGACRIGDRIAILYDPDDPAKPIRADRRWAGVLGACVMGALFCVVGAVCFFFMAASAP
jgi:hypothetical protein